MATRKRKPRTKKPVITVVTEVPYVEEEIQDISLDDIIDAELNVDTTVTSIPDNSTSMSINKTKQSHSEDNVLDVVKSIIKAYDIEEPLEDVCIKFEYFLTSRNILFPCLTTKNINTFAKVMRHYNLTLIRYELGY